MERSAFARIASRMWTRSTKPRANQLRNCRRGCRGVTKIIRSRNVKSQGDEWYSFGVFEKNDDRRLLGGVGLNFINRVHEMGNLGYWVRTSATRNGIASKAARLVAQFGFEELGLHRIEIIAAIPNIASQRVAEKIGAVREAVLRKRLLIRDQSQDAVLFSLVPEDLGLPGSL